MTTFVDRVDLHATAGDGGHGCASVHREKFKPLGGPDGGNGGRGGNVVLVVDPSVTTLIGFHHRPHQKATSGRPGQGNNRSGSLIVSYLLMRAGLPPFVLTLENAEGYFNPSSVIRNSAKHGVKSLYELPKIKKKYAAFLEDHSPDPQKFFVYERKLPAYQGGA